MYLFVFDLFFFAFIVGNLESIYPTLEPDEIGIPHLYPLFYPIGT